MLEIVNRIAKRCKSSHLTDALTLEQAIIIQEEMAAAIGEVTAERDALAAACKLLDDFQRQYEANAWDKMPGNDLYAPWLMRIVDEARAALALVAADTAGKEA